MNISPLGGQISNWAGKKKHLLRNYKKEPFFLQLQHTFVDNIYFLFPGAAKGPRSENRLSPPPVSAL